MVPGSLAGGAVFCKNVKYHIFIRDFVKIENMVGLVELVQLVGLVGWAGEAGLGVIF